MKEKNKKINTMLVSVIPLHLQDTVVNDLINLMLEHKGVCVFTQISLIYE